MLPQFPRLMYQNLNENRTQELEKRMTELLIEEKRQTRLLFILSILIISLIVWQVWP